MQANDLLPATHFDSTFLAPADRFAAWRASVRPVFDVDLLPQDDEYSFQARAELYQLGDIVAGSVVTQAQYFRQALASERTDHILVQLHLSGSYQGDMDGHDVRVAPGCVSFIDLSRPLRTHAEDCRIVNIVIPRSHFEASPKFLNNLHGMVLSPGRGGFLADYMGSLMTRLPHLSQGEAEDVAGISRDMIMTSAYWDAWARDRIGPEMRYLAKQRVQRLIELHLTSPRLTPEWLSRSAALSRAQLYRLFSDEGGVVRYIQYRRMAYLRRCLEDPQDVRSIHELAAQGGFRSPAHFSRSFKKLYGVTPRDWRHVAQHQAMEADSRETPELSRWARQLGR